MAGKKGSLLSLSSKVQGALKTASALMNAKQRQAATAFMQAPFTGTYTSQSAEIMGIIKQMRDTFIKDLADAQKTEKNAKEAYDKFMEVKKDAWDSMKSD